MEKYKHLRYAIELFSADWELTEEEYQETFSSFVNAEPDYTKRIKKELIQALNDPEWSWVKIGYETNFIGSDDSEESVWLSVKDLIWNVIASNEEPPMRRFV
ncbi:hypothetical protein Q4517_04425 [Tenacibaculum sp. 1_MG-2023]|uniref:hypothetical protein n=1 Tax=Tenacibaculum sp. 1_MG-2023 TaxID=3062653 RepID=UPI0026E170B7|nr:hypothetical protein [Tenacibaculum sp. 1_MG-2023]MDO6674790.1 hypothetical protein [Tenacibaculum sp. 1_MG-2023]